jgi:excinuclease UvrABC helicase subunit UvrB
MKTFDELFNEFFKRNDIKPEDKINNLKEEAKKMIDILTNMKNIEEDIKNIDEEIEKSIDEELGKPDKIEFFNEDNLFFERRTWHTENGDLIKLLVSDDPTFGKQPKVEKSLQQQMEEAIQNEEYEKAAILRDKIHVKMGVKKVRKSRKKTNND